MTSADTKTREKLSVMERILGRRFVTPIVPAPEKVWTVSKGDFVTINEAHYVVAVDGDEATISMRDPATGETRHVIYPLSRLKVCHGVKASGNAKRARLAPEQPAKSPADSDT